MKDIAHLIILTLGIAALLIIALPAADQHPAATLDNLERSWIEYCRARHIDPHTNDTATQADFLDTWRGSVEEEQALTRQGIEA